MANTGGVVVPPIQLSLTTTGSIPTLKRTRSRTDSLSSPSDSPLCSPRVALGDKPITAPSTLGDLLAAAKKMQLQPIAEEEVVPKQQPLQHSETTSPTTTNLTLFPPLPHNSKVEKSDQSTTRETPKSDLHLKKELEEKKKEENVAPLTDAWDTAVANTPRPHEPKQRSFAPDQSWNPGVVPPTSVLHPSGTSAWEAMNFFFVAPLTLLTPTNLFYQLYLMEIFHTKFASRAVHTFMMPMVTWSYLLFAAHIGLPFSFFDSVGFAETGINIFEIRGNAVLTLGFFIWYLYWGIKSKTYAFGLFMIPQLCILWLSSNVFYLLTRDSDSLLLNSFFLAFVFAFIQTMSHVVEDLPPRMNGSDHWMTYDQFFSRHGYNYFKIGYIIGVSIICGTINEFLAGPRLLPLLTLRLMYSLGYQKKDWKELKKVVAMAKQSADPAIDFVGSGGTLPDINVEPPKTLADALQELQELKWRRVRNRGFEDEELELRVAYLLMLLSKVPEPASLSPASPEKEEEEENNEPQELSEESLGEPETEHVEWEAHLALKRANSCPLTLSADAALKPPEEKLRKRRKSL